ncbi:hypothetical protein C8R46DRAFT_1208104 [Mycena filopes]|nr:hypothetical protein C8R46DRAFT_1208104 [Mycena filopes]
MAAGIDIRFSVPRGRSSANCVKGQIYGRKMALKKEHKNWEVLGTEEVLVAALQSRHQAPRLSIPSASTTTAQPSHNHDLHKLPAPPGVHPLKGTASPTKIRAPSTSRNTHLYANHRNGSARVLPSGDPRRCIRCMRSPDHGYLDRGAAIAIRVLKYPSVRSCLRVDIPRARIEDIARDLHARHLKLPPPTVRVGTQYDTGTFVRRAYWGWRRVKAGDDG